jgi:hypothetical protein
MKGAGGYQEIQNDRSELNFVGVGGIKKFYDF